jgi:hypothetical protein
MANLQSPGVDVRIIEEELSAGVGPGTVPLIFIATATNKITETGSLAEGTTVENAGKLELITSQRELLQKYGLPSFREVDGTVIQGDETNEYGLHSAYSYLGLANRAYVVRADLDTSQLLPSENMPRGKAANGTFWFDYTNTSFGIFVANGNVIPGLAWNLVEPLLPTSAEVDQNTGVPLSTYGVNGNYAVVTSFADNAVYEKISGTWLLIGSSAWDSAKPVGTTFTFAPHTDVPNGENVGSIWIKTTSPNNGADYKIYRYNSTQDQFVPVNAPLYANDSAATSAYGSALSIGSLYVKYGPDATHVVLRWNGTAWATLSYVASVSEPDSDAPEGTLWFNAALEADIMVNTGNQWRGYRNLYPATDPNGPLITSERPLFQSTGAPLANYDLWIDSSDTLSYPKVYRYLNGDWVLIDNTDRTTPFGIVFGDIRENSGPAGPWIRGGLGATATASMKAVNVFIANAGEGYTDGTYTASVIGGTSSVAATLSVVVAGGTVISATVNAAGVYTVIPGVTVSVSGITGSPSVAAQFNISWGVHAIAVVDGGAGYTSAPVLNIVGGGGVGATAQTAIDINGEVDTITVTNAGSGYTSIPTVIINTPFGKPESESIADMLVSDWNDPVELDILNPQIFPAGIILFNTRRSTNNVKVWRSKYFEDVSTYTVGNFLSSAYETANPGAQAAALDYLARKPQRWVSFSGNDLNGVGLFGRFAQRICIVRAMAAEIIGNQDIRSEFINYNLVTAPGYIELYDELITLNVDRGETAFIITDVPIDLKPNATDISAWANNTRNVASNGRLGRTNMYDYAAMYYPWALGTNVDGKEIVIPSSTVALRTYGFNDNVAYPWFPPAGSRRGVITNASSVGYVDLVTRNYTAVTLNPGQRDTLYNNKINPLAFIPGRGLLVFGDKTLSPNDGSALSRVNVARMVVYLRTVLPNALVPFLFELNTERTRSAARNVVTAILVDLLSKEGISDFLVVADSSNNTPDVIDRNELVIDVLVAPTKSINFILVPVRIRRTGSI